MNASDHSHVILLDLWPDRATYKPGEPATIQAALANNGARPSPVRLNLRLYWLDQQVAGVQDELEVLPGGLTASLPVILPGGSFRGYGADLTIHDMQGQVLDHGSTALDVLDDWTEAPRYGFLSDFVPGDPAAAETVAVLARYHVNVVQFYDWMWRHYALMPPQDDFADALGRRLSLRTVRRKVAACHAHGMEALGYAAVYGAEPEYALPHPGEMLYDAEGQPYSLEKLFYIMNIHQGNPWRARILEEMARAVRAVPFDGLHLDQYGFPKDAAFGPRGRSLSHDLPYAGKWKDPAAYDLAQDFPPLIDDARRASREARAGSRVIFNAVGNWPIETVAPTTQDATYIEVWPPYDTYSDLQALILEARRLAPAKQVILAAYLTPLLGALGETLPPAEAATRLASATIWANGGFHLLLGERNGALCDPYYPKYATLTPDFARVMGRYYDFVVRYENVLSDRRLVPATGKDGPAAVHVRGADASPFAQPGQVWTIARTMPGLRTVSLINLVAASDANWNAAKPRVQRLHDLTVEFVAGGPVEGVFLASPDDSSPAARPLAHAVRGDGDDTRVQVHVPQLDYWSLIVAKIGSACLCT